MVSNGRYSQHIALVAWLLAFPCFLAHASGPGGACCPSMGGCIMVASATECDAVGGLFAPGQVCGTDTDGDGCDDVCVDACPGDPNKCAPGQCGCGVPDTDTDSDGTADCNDLCPFDPLKIHPGICGCGIPEDIGDEDGDGCVDCNDGCPGDPTKCAPGICGCGVPDTDTDGDGTPDCLDECPENPNLIAPANMICCEYDPPLPPVLSCDDNICDKIDCCPGPCGPPGVCGCCNNVDSDGDGVLNCVDDCPNDPNKTSPGVCGCNVPDIDTDGDTIPDCNDVCPGEDDTIDANNNGQPDCAATGRPVPTTTTWGLVALTLLLLCGARIRFRTGPGTT